MLVFCVGVLIIVGIAANAEQCRYEFVVPDGNCRSNPEPVPEEEAQSIMHVHSSLDMTNERLNAMAQEFTKQLTLLDGDSKQFKEVTGVLESKLATVQENLADLKGLKDDVQALKKSITDTSDSLNPKLEALTDKMINIDSLFQSQSEALKHTAETVQDLMKKVGSTSEGNKGLGDILARIDGIEDKMAQGSSSEDIINRLKSAVNLLQNELLSSANQYRGQIQMLAGTVNTLRLEMETLKKSVQVK